MNHFSWLLLSSFLLVIFISPAFAADRYLVNNGATKTIDEHGVCKDVTNNAGGTIMVPCKAPAEWSSFLSHLPPGVTAPDCAASGGGNCTPAQENTFTQVANLPEDGYGFAAAPLSDGRILICGGDGGAINRCDTYDPVANNFTQVTNLPESKYNSAAAPLSDGRVLFCGGQTSAVLATNRCDVYDPVADSFTQVANLPQAKWVHAAASLSDGRVLFCGGDTGSYAYTNRCDIYDSVANSFTQVANLPQAKWVHAAASLSDGRVLFCGGYTGSPTNQCDIYNINCSSGGAGVSCETLTAGDNNSCIVKMDGSLVCWGGNVVGESTPPAGTDYASVSAGGYILGDKHVCALKTDGSIVCWGGYNNNGETSPPAGTDYTSISVSMSRSCALKTDGSIVCWGWNGYGQNNPPAGTDYTSVAPGVNHSCALKTDGSIVCWGSNTDGASTPPSGTDYAQIGAGWDFSCALKTDGSLECWGSNSLGSTAPPAGTDYTSISTGQGHSCALKTDGSIVCWGWNNQGQSSPPAGTDYIGINAGSMHNCAIKTDNSLACWGFNNSGQSSPPAGNDYGCPAPDGCPNIGDVCTDGSINAGQSNGTKMYAADVDQGAGITWGPSIDTGADSSTDGKANQAWVIANTEPYTSWELGNYPAFELCEILNRHSHTDWYLPAKDELNILYQNRVLIGGFNTDYYWSSTESSTTQAWRQRFSSGTQAKVDKENVVGRDIRCVRR